MSRYTKIFLSLSFLFLFPLITLAATSYLQSVMDTFKLVIKTVLPAFVGLSIIGFAWGLFIYLKGGAEDKEQGKTLIIWGGLAVVVLLSLYGLAGLLQNITGARNLNVTVPTTYKS